MNDLPTDPMWTTLDPFGRGPMHWDRGGRPINMRDWVYLGEDHEYRIVKQDQVGRVRVSTVWLGIDMGWGRSEPLIFETMIFGGKHDLETWRYSSEAEAMAAHTLILSAVKAESHGGIKHARDERRREMKYLIRRMEGR